MTQLRLIRPLIGLFCIAKRAFARGAESFLDIDRKFAETVHHEINPPAAPEGDAEFAALLEHGDVDVPTLRDLKIQHFKGGAKLEAELDATPSAAAPATKPALLFQHVSQPVLFQATSICARHVFCVLHCLGVYVPVASPSCRRGCVYTCRCASTWG